MHTCVHSCRKLKSRPAPVAFFRVLILMIASLAPFSLSFSCLRIALCDFSWCACRSKVWPLILILFPKLIQTSPPPPPSETEMELNQALTCQEKERRRQRFRYLVNELSKLTDQCQLHDQGLDSDLRLCIVHWLRALPADSVQQPFKVSLSFHF